MFSKINSWQSCSKRRNTLLLCKKGRSIQSKMQKSGEKKLIEIKVEIEKKILLNRFRIFKFRSNLIFKYWFKSFDNFSGVIPLRDYYQCMGLHCLILILQKICTYAWQPFRAQTKIGFLSILFLLCSRKKLYTSANMSPKSISGGDIY